MPSKLNLVSNFVKLVVEWFYLMEHPYLIPLLIYFKGPYAKVELAVAAGKKSYDKREAIKQRDAKRDIAQRLRRDTN